MIDSHVHIWDARRHPMSWLSRHSVLADRYGLDDLMAEAGDAAPDQLVLVQAGTTLPGLEWLLREAGQNGRVAGVVASVPSHDPHAAQRWIDQAVRTVGGELVRGVRVSGRREGADYFERPEIRHLMDAISGRGLIPCVLAEPNQLIGIARTAAASGGKVIVDHLGAPPLGEDSTPRNLAEWMAGISALGSVGNVLVKLSGARLVAPEYGGSAEALVDHAYRALGSRRLMFGSDWPMTTPHLRYPAVVAQIHELLRRVGANTDASQIWRSTAQVI